MNVIHKLQTSTPENNDYRTSAETDSIGNKWQNSDRNDTNGFMKISDDTWFSRKVKQILLYPYKVQDSLFISLEDWSNPNPRKHMSV